MPDRSRAGSLRIREIRVETDAAFRPAFRLLSRAFPRAELLPRRAWVQVMRERRAGLWSDLNWHLFVAVRGTRVVGVGSGSYLGNLNVGVIGYIAVVPKARSLGIGPRLRLALQLAFERDARRIRRAALEALVGEVRADNPWLRHLVRRRAAIALDFPYVQPSLHGRERAVPLVLYYQPLRGPRASVPARAVRQLLYTMWRRMYRVANPLSHPAFRRMVRSLRDRERIGRRPLEPAASQAKVTIA